MSHAPPPISCVAPSPRLAPHSLRPLSRRGAPVVLRGTTVAHVGDRGPCCDGACEGSSCPRGSRQSGCRATDGRGQGAGGDDQARSRGGGAGAAAAAWGAAAGATAALFLFAAAGARPSRAAGEQYGARRTAGHAPSDASGGPVPAACGGGVGCGREAGGGGGCRARMAWRSTALLRST